ncbi:hypothetical protein [Candidatus Jidaibacter acanthamoebae]|nr:hypothetical protein [Candidatus Jidaibacter acanthamoeba]
MAEYHFAESEGMFLGYNTWSAPWSSLDVIEPYIKEYNISLPRENYVINLNGELVNLEHSYNNFTTPLSNNQTSINYLHPIFMDKLVMGEEGLNIFNTKSDIIIINVNDNEPAELKSELNISGKPAQLYIFSKSGFDIEDIKLSGIVKFALIAADFFNYYDKSEHYDANSPTLAEIQFDKNLTAINLKGNVSANNTVAEFYASSIHCQHGTLNFKDLNFFSKNSLNQLSNNPPLDFSTCSINVENIILEVPEAFTILSYNGSINAKQAKVTTLAPFSFSIGTINVVNALDIEAPEVIIDGTINATNFTVTAGKYLNHSPNKTNVNENFYWIAKDSNGKYTGIWDDNTKLGNVKGTIGFIGQHYYATSFPKCKGLNLELYGNFNNKFPPFSHSDSITDFITIYAPKHFIPFSNIANIRNVDIKCGSVYFAEDFYAVNVESIKIESGGIGIVWGKWQVSKEIRLIATRYGDRIQLGVVGLLQTLGNVFLSSEVVVLYESAQIDCGGLTEINYKFFFHPNRYSKIRTYDLILENLDREHCTGKGHLKLQFASIEVSNNAVIKESSMHIEAACSASVNRMFRDQSCTPSFINVKGNLYLDIKEAIIEESNIQAGQIINIGDNAPNILVKTSPSANGGCIPASFVGREGIYGKFNKIETGCLIRSTFYSNDAVSQLRAIAGYTANGVITAVKSDSLSLINNFQVVIAPDPSRPIRIDEQEARPAKKLNKKFFELKYSIIENVPKLGDSNDPNNAYYEYLYNERYTPLKSCNIDITYILRTLSFTPEMVGKIICDSNCQVELVKKALEEKLGFREISALDHSLRAYLISIGVYDKSLSERHCTEVKLLLDSGIEHASKLQLQIGIPPMQNQFHLIEKPFIWPVYEDFEGIKVLTPAVYFPKEMIFNAPARAGAFMMAGFWDVSINSLFSAGSLLGEQGHIKALDMAVVGELKKSGDGALILEVDRLAIASLMHTQTHYEYTYTQRLTYGALSAEKGEVTLLIKQDFLLQAAKLKGKITAQVGGDIIAVPGRDISGYQRYYDDGYVKFASLRNVLNTFEGEIRFSSGGNQYYEGLVIEGNSVVNFLSEKGGINLVVAKDFDYSESYEEDEGFFSSESIHHVRYQERAIGNQIGESKNPLRELNVISHGDIALYAAKVYTKKLYMEAGVNNPEKANVVLGSVGLQSFEQTTVEKSGLGFGNGMVGIKTTTKVTQNSRVNQEPSVIVIVGDKDDPTDNTAYIVTNGKYTQLSSHINHETGKFVIIAPGGIEIGANDNERVNIVHTIKEMVGFGVSATKEEIGLKMGVEIKESYRERVDFIPIQSSITAKQLELHSKNGYLHTKGAILTYQDALIKGLGHIDEPAERRSSQLNKDFSASLHLKLGFRSSLSNAIDSTKDTFQSNVATPEGAINAVFKAYNMLVNWAKFITMPVQGGMYIHGKIKKERLEITRVEPVVSEFTSFGNTTHETDKIYFKGTRIIGYKWYVRAKDVHLAAAFSSYEESRSGSSGEIIIPLGGGIIPSLSVTPISKNKGSVQNYHMLQVMIKDEIIFDIGGPVNIEGGYMEADKIIMNAKSLVLNSVQRLAESKSSGFSLSGSDITAINTALTGGGGYYGRSETKWVEEIAGIIGKEKLELVINETLKIAGAVIANAERNENGTYTDKGKLYIKAAEVIAESIYGYDEGALLGASYSSGSGSGNSFVGASYGAQFGYTDKEQEVKAGLGGGTIDAPLNGEYSRDINNLKHESGTVIDPINAQYTEFNWGAFKDAYSEDGKFSFSKLGEHMAKSFKNSYYDILDSMPESLAYKMPHKKLDKNIDKAIKDILDNDKSLGEKEQAALKKLSRDMQDSIPENKAEITREALLGTSDKAKETKAREEKEHETLTGVRKPGEPLDMGTIYACNSDCIKAQPMKKLANKINTAAETYRKFEQEHPTLAHHGLTLANAAIQTLLFGLAGTINVVKGEIINRGIDKLAGEEINKVINQLIDSASWGFKQGLPGLTEEEARTLGSASVMLGIGITQGTTAIKSIIKDIGKPHIVHKVDLSEQPKSKSKVNNEGVNKKKEDISAKDSKPETEAHVKDLNSLKVKEVLDKLGWELPQEALNKIPRDLKFVKANREGVGIRIQDSEKGASVIRIDKGNPSNDYLHQQVDHVRINYNGQVIGRDGKPILQTDKTPRPREAPEAHIPLSEWLQWKEWNKP